MRFIKIIARAVTLGAIALCAVSASIPAHAASGATAEPATLGFSAGYFEVLQHEPKQPAADFRLEYRSAFDMLSLAKAQNSTITIRPFTGVETTSDGALYGLGGFVFDMVFWNHWVVSPNVGVGLFYGGDGRRLGSFVEFRSTMETGYRFDDGSRLTAAFGHISNAGLTGTNPGTEILSFYYHVPVAALFGK